MMIEISAQIAVTYLQEWQGLPVTVSRISGINNGMDNVSYRISELAMEAHASAVMIYDRLVGKELPCECLNGLEAQQPVCFTTRQDVKILTFLCGRSCIAFKF